MKKKCYLIIEDSTEIQRLFGMILDDTKVSFYQAQTISEAEEMFEVCKSQLTHIFIDGCVPGNKLNTLDLTQKIRSEFKGHMIAMSSNPEFNEILEEAGCDESIEKFMLHKKINQL
jgi:CheY-like chemotaxis protein